VDLNLIQHILEPCLLPYDLLVVEDLDRDLGHGGTKDSGFLAFQTHLGRP
jgi:hypothetical protein